MERNTYMQSLMTATYPKVAIEAISNGFDGAWERLIANQLLKDSGSSNVFTMMSAHNVLEATGCKVWDMETCLKAAYMITSSKPCA